MLLVEKTDRLYRNLKDWVTIDELEVEIHFPKEGVVLSRDSRSSEKFMHGIKVLMAKNYIDNLSEEARRACGRKPSRASGQRRRRSAIATSLARTARRLSRPTRLSRPIISKLFEWYATGQYSLKRARSKARDAGLVYRKSGAQGAGERCAHDSANPALYGPVRMERRALSKASTSRSFRLSYGTGSGCARRPLRQEASADEHDFAFSGLITCANCGCSLVGEIKKQRTSTIIARAMR